MRAHGVNWIERSARILACASLALAPTLSLAASEEDPWESINRPIFTFNDTLDTYALKPLAQGYQKVPRTSFRTACTTSSTTSAT